MKSSINIAAIPELSAMVTYVCRQSGRNQLEIEIALHLVGEMVAAGRSNAVEILREIQARLAADLPRLMEEANARRNATRSAALTYRETGTKPSPTGPSPHAVHRSNKRAPGARWDLEEGRDQ